MVKTKMKKPEVPEILTDADAPFNEKVLAMMEYLEAKYSEWSDEELGAKRREASDRAKAHAETIELADAAISDAFVADSRGVDEADLDADLVGDNVRRVQQEIGQAHAKMWRASLVWAETDHELRRRRVDQLSEERRTLSPKIDKLEKKIQDLQAELNSMRSVNQGLGYQVRDNQGDVKGRVGNYLKLLEGPNFRSYEKLSRRIGAG